MLCQKIYIYYRNDEKFLTDERKLFVKYVMQVIIILQLMEIH